MASNPSLEPLQPPPAGQVSNFVNPVSTAAQINVVVAVFCPISAVTIALRIYTRGWLVGKIASDDYLLLVAAVFAYSSTLGMHATTRYGLGRHSWDEPVSLYLPTIPKLWMANAINYSVAMLCVKLSFLFLYRRLFFGSSSRFVWQWWIVFLPTLGYNIGGIMSSLLACIPISLSWDPTKKGHCINIAAFYIANGCLNVITDLCILALPIPVILRTSFTLRQKVMLCIIFGTGSFTCVVSAIRIKSIVDYLNEQSVDITRVLVPFCMWSIIEMHCAIICASVATLKPFIQRYFTRLLSSHHQSNNAGIFITAVVGGTASNGRLSLQKRTVLSAHKLRAKSNTYVNVTEDEVALGDTPMKAGDLMRNSWFKSSHGSTTANCMGPRSSSEESTLAQQREGQRRSNDVQVVTTMEVSYGDAAKNGDAMG